MNWLTELEKYQDEFIQDLKGLIAIPSVRDDSTKAEGAPFGAGCRKALDYMLELGRREGFEVKDYDGYAGVISYGDGEESVGVLAHLDVVPVGVGWSKDPFAAEIIDGYMFGRGTLDDKGPAMSGFYALKMLKDKGIKLNRKVMLILGCDEESGMECMEYYTKHGEIPTLGFTPDADFPVIYGEKGGLHIEMSGSCETVISSMHAGERPNIVIGQAEAVVKEWKDEYLDSFFFYLRANDLKGNVETLDGKTAKLFIEGVFAHAAMPYNGVNAALHILNFVGACYGDKFAQSTYAMLKDWQGKPLGIDIDGAYMGFLTMNTGIVNIENGSASITIDIRYPNDADVDKIMKGFYDTANSLEYPLDITLCKDTKPLFVDPNSELVTKLTNVYQEYTKDTFTPNKTIGGGTYAKKFKNFVAFGPEFAHNEPDTDMFIGGCHQKDEAVKLTDLMTAAAIYVAAVEQLAK
ncbi:dipeptidase PepV [Erysipelotrichaceae bacterium HCN-30851]